MTLQLWPFLALLFSFCGAIIIGFNQWAKVDGRVLVVFRSAGVWPLALLSALFLPWPHDVMFYAVAALMGVGLAYADVILHNASAEFGGRLAALYVPLKMLVAFALWAFLAPETLVPLMFEPWRVVLLVLGFGLCGGALMFMRRVDASFAALIAITPVAMLFALGDVVAKEALGEVTMEHGMAALVGRTIAFLWVTNTVGSVGAFMLGGALHFTRTDVLKSILFGVVLLLGLTLLLVTIALAPNPGYVAAITMLSALWLALYASVVRGEHNNWWAGIALLVGAIAVALATGV